MKQLDLLIIFLFSSVSVFSQYDYVGNSGNDCSSNMTVSYTYTEYSQGSHGHGYHIYRDGVLIRSQYDEFGGYYVMSLDFLNDSVGFVTQSYQGIVGVYRTLDYGENWEWMGGQNLEFHDIYFVNQYTAYLFGRKHHLTDNVTIERIIKNNQRTVFSIDTVTAQTMSYNEFDTIMGEPLCENQQNLIFSIQKSGTDISFEIIFNHILSEIPDITGKSLISLYPNPADDIIYLNSNYDILKILIYDCTGKLLKNNSVHDKAINISELNKGLYFLSAETKGKIFTAKFVKE